jgi:Zn-dependent M32 family carboxypeptidase|tara:strand:- start:344 stop:742 length:399 start_codon:yes stop_codon:yes gene_type:complete
MKISDNTSVAMPMRNLIAIIGAVAVGTMAYFNIVEQLNKHSTTLELMAKDQEHNTEFRIKWPRGEMGSLPADAEQFMLIEDLYKTVEKLEKNQEMNMTNKVNIEFLQKQVEKMAQDLEKLKDKVRANGNGGH